MQANALKKSNDSTHRGSVKDERSDTDETARVLYDQHGKQPSPLSKPSVKSASNNVRGNYWITEEGQSEILNRIESSKPPSIRSYSYNGRVLEMLATSESASHLPSASRFPRSLTPRGYAQHLDICPRCPNQNQSDRDRANAG